jgi:hypothetical protein
VAFKMEASTKLEAFAVLGCYMSQVGSWLPMFRDNISVLIRKPLTLKQAGIAASKGVVR